MEFPDLILQLKTLSTQFNCRLIHIETKASGLSIKQQLVRDGFNCKDLKANGDKTSRVNGVTPAMESGRVVMVEDTWVENALQQLAGFGAGAAHDDIVDAIVYSIDTLLNKNSFSYSML
jgi:predicted phage terminase large subunit-like protein